LELDENFKLLVHELGQAINNALAGSDDVAEVMARIRSAGYDLVLVLELTIGFNKRNGAEVAGKRKLAGDLLIPLELNFTSEDAQFLRSLKINLKSEK
jgi:hypothetical protein